MARSDGELLGGQRREGARPGIADAVDQLLRNRIVGGAGLIVFHPLLVIDQSGGQHIGLTVVEVVKQLADVLPDGYLKRDAKVVGKLLRQFVIQTERFIVHGGEGHWRVDGADAQLAASDNARHPVLGFTRPGDRRPQGSRQQKGDNADQQIINL